MYCYTPRHRRRRASGGRHKYGPWSWEARFFNKGELALAVLSLLEDGPKHGYELMKELEDRSHGLYRPSAGSVYPILQQLLDQDLATASEEEGGKKVYELTKAGKERVKSRQDTIDRIWQRTDEDEWTGWRHAYHSEASEVMRPAFRLMRVAVRTVAEASDPEEVAEEVRDILRKARRDIQKLGEEGA